MGRSLDGFASCLRGLLGVKFPVALVVLSKVEQRLDAVRAVLGGAQLTEVAAAVGVSRQTLHSWLTRYLLDGVGGLADRSHQPNSCPLEHGAWAAIRYRPSARLQLREIS